MDSVKNVPSILHLLFKKVFQLAILLNAGGRGEESLHKMVSVNIVMIIFILIVIIPNAFNIHVLIFINI
jgi:hypothetical protein